MQHPCVCHFEPHHKSSPCPPMILPSGEKAFTFFTCKIKIAPRNYGFSVKTTPVRVMLLDVIPDLNSHLEAKLQSSGRPTQEHHTITSRQCGSLPLGQLQDRRSSLRVPRGNWAVDPAGSTQQEWESQPILPPLHLTCSFEMSPFSTHHNSKQFLHLKKVISEKLKKQTTDQHCYFDCSLNEKNAE